MAEVAWGLARFDESGFLRFALFGLVLPVLPSADWVPLGILEALTWHTRFSDLTRQAPPGPARPH